MEVAAVVVVAVVVVDEEEEFGNDFGPDEEEFDEPEIESIFPMANEMNDSDEEEFHEDSCPTKSCTEELVKLKG